MLERVEKCLDWLALQMEVDFGEYGNRGLIAYYRQLSAESDRLRADQDVRSKARERARRLKRQTA
jgi:hypothetical protein